MAVKMGVTGVTEKMVVMGGTESTEKMESMAKTELHLKRIGKNALGIALWMEKITV